MKNIAIITNNHTLPLGSFLKKNLELVLGNYVNINTYFFSQFTADTVIDDDIVLVMTKGKSLEFKNYIADMRRIVVVQRTIREAEIYKIFSIPSNAKVLVVNDNSETTLELVSILYQLEIAHLHFIPYEEDRDYHDINIAITAGESWRVPAYIHAVIDIGNRYIDIATFIKIINILELSDRELSRQLIKYSDSVVALDTGIKKHYKELFMRNTELDMVLNLSREGILLLNTAGFVNLCNESLMTMLDISQPILHAKAEAVLPVMIANIINQDSVNNEVVEYKGRSLVINKRDLHHFGEKSGTFFTFQEITYIKQLEDKLTKKLREKGLVARYHFTDIKTQSPRMLQCIEFARGIASSDLTILITGESGTGKELFAQSIHNASERSKQPFVAFNCAAVPESLMESELFGYEGGSFTGALREGKVGLFEQANSGTVFLDEIGDMPYTLQAKLLRVLQERQVTRVGSQKVFNVNIRVIAATNNNLREKIKSGQYRSDLYYRLNVLPLIIPPLRERQEDIIYLLHHFFEEKNKPITAISSEAHDLLLQYKWPGNIRELENVASYLSYMANAFVEPRHLPHDIINCQESFDWEFNVLVSKCYWEKSLQVLSIVAEFNALDKGAGRKSIEETLANKNVVLREGEIRRILALLAELEFIHSGIGRRGSEITFKGKSLLNWSRNR